MDEANPITYECSKEGTCFCDDEDGFKQCKGNEEDPEFEDNVEWIELIPDPAAQCFGS